MIEMDSNLYLKSEEKCCYFCGVSNGGSRRYRFYVYSKAKPVYVCIACIQAKGGSKSVLQELERELKGPMLINLVKRFQAKKNENIF